MKEPKKPFQIDKPRTWMQRPGQMASTDLKGDGRRYIVHRWSDTGETTLKDVTGNAWDDPMNFAIFSEWDLGTTDSIGDAVAAADRMRNDADRITKRIGGFRGNHGTIAKTTSGRPREV